MIIPKHHQKFIELLAAGEDQYKAWQVCGKKKASKATCEQQSCRLARRYSKEITQANEDYQAAIREAKKKEVVQTALESLLHQTEVDAILCKIITGELLAEKKIIYLNKEGQKVTTTLLCKPEHSDILKAIDIYNKRFGSYAPEKHELNTFKITIGETTNRDYIQTGNI